MKAAVTGSTGFIGRALVASLRAQGTEVRALVRKASPEGAKKRLGSLGAALIEGDVCDEPSMNVLFSGCDVVVHAAALSDPRAPREAHERVNLVGTENALAAAKAAGVKRFVLVSTEAVTRAVAHRSYVDEKYPSPAEFLDESAHTRSLAEDIVVAAHGSGIDTVSLRPAAVWGPDDTVFLPRLLRAVRAHRFAWIDGGASLFASTYIRTLCEAIERAMTVADAGAGVFYVTDDERQSVREFLTALLSAAGVRAPTRSVPFGVAYAAAWASEKTTRALTRTEVVALGRSANFNVQRARRELGWSPSVTVAEGVSRTRAWIERVGVERVIAAEVSERSVET